MYLNQIQPSCDATSWSSWRIFFTLLQLVLQMINVLHQVEVLQKSSTAGKISDFLLTDIK